MSEAGAGETPAPVTGRFSVHVPDAAAGSRADRFMADASGLSRAYVQRLISDGRLAATRPGTPGPAGRQTLRARDPVLPGMHLELDVPAARDDAVLPEAIPLDIVYRDDDVLVIDKPAGLVTHPAPGHESGTLVNALLGLDAGEGGLGTLAGVRRPGIVHRLDRDTSGLLIVARNDAAQASLQAQLRARRVRKTYQALVGGVVAAQVGRIEKPIGRDPRMRQRMAVVADGKDAVTGYRVRERFDEWTLLELDLVTGRTHQARVHLASIGHPVAGDRTYANGRVRRGPDVLERMFLHAWRLEFLSPATGRLVHAEAPLPVELESALQGLRAAQTAERR
ncbi:RluA family pseudouridine synthase [soil metagenome]